MPTPWNNQPFTLDGLRCVPLGPGLLYREDRVLGLCRRYHLPESSTAVLWRTPAQLAERAGVPVQTLADRVRARWSAADLLKPAGWERIVEARRGLELDGQTRPLQDWATLLGTTVNTLQYRLQAGWPVRAVLTPTPKRIEGVERSTLPTPVPTVWGSVRGRFLYDGAVDTLPGHCRALGLSLHTVRARLRKGATIERALSPNRMPRSDRGKPNWKRSSKRWDLDARTKGALDDPNSFDEHPATPTTTPAPADPNPSDTPAGEPGAA